MTDARTAAVEVPASCANLGPGFDTLAAAVDLYLVARVAPPAAVRVASEDAGAGELPTDDTNLVWRSFAAYCERFGVEVPDVSLHVSSEIPLERGLGSSAAAAVAGAALARLATEAGGSDQDLIDIAAGLEGHADNAAAATLGGVVACPQGRAWRFEPTPQLRPVVCVPRERQSTQAARGVLPDHVPLEDAAVNGGRTALVLAGLTGGCAFDADQMVDRLHEPSRFEAMPAAGALVAELRNAGFGACLSGAGPSVLAIVEDRDGEAVERIGETAGRGWDVRPSAWNRSGATVRPPAIVGT